MIEKKTVNTLDDFRESLKDVVVIVEKLGKYAENYLELVQICQLAILDRAA